MSSRSREAQLVAQCASQLIRSSLSDLILGGEFALLTRDVALILRAQQAELWTVRGRSGQERTGKMSGKAEREEYCPSTCRPSVLLTGRLLRHYEVISAPIPDPSPLT